MKCSMKAVFSDPIMTQTNKSALLKEADIYTMICENRGIPVEDAVVRSLTRASATGTLDMSGVSVLQETCNVLGHIISETKGIFSVNLCDCLLPPRGLTTLLKGLANNGNIIALNLKGNNIAGPSIARVGQMIQRNRSIQRLSLEWNSLGLYPDLFQSFCSSLSKNNTLRELDLQNNQLSSDCAAILSEYLLKNSSIKFLDLSWNSLGWQGGQYLLRTLQENKTITTVKLHGNRIPSDLLETLGQCTACNESKEKMAKENDIRQNFLTRQLKKAQAQKDEEVEALMRQMNGAVRELEDKLRESENRITERESSIASLETQLNDSHVEVERAYARLQEIEKELADALVSASQREERLQGLMSAQRKSMQEETDLLKKRVRELEAESNTKEMTLKTELVVAKGAADTVAQKLAEAEERLKFELQSVRVENERQLLLIRKQHEEELAAASRNAEERTRHSAEERALKLAEDRLNRAIADGEAKAAAAATAAATAAASAAADAAEAARNQRRLEEKIRSLESTLADAERSSAEASSAASAELRRLERERDAERGRAEDAEARAERLLAEKRELTKKLDAEGAARAAAERERDAERSRLLAQLQNTRAEEARRASALYAAFTTYLAPQALSTVPT